MTEKDWTKYLHILIRNRPEGSGKFRWKFEFDRAGELATNYLTDKEFSNFICVIGQSLCDAADKIEPGKPFDPLDFDPSKTIGH